MCGIFGIINTEPKTFDYQTFCTLGICNDERGGDSCGVFIDGKYEYGVDKLKLFGDFYQNSKVLQETEKAQIALGHCRKASIGVVKESTAQPVVITENGVPKFVVIHNGTIFNYEALAKKYIPNINIEGMTDSQVMARIFYHCGYDVLQEYNGGAVFVIVDYRGEKPEVLLFKGCSLACYTAVIPIEERPLFVVFEKNRMIFSSIARYLRCGRKKREVYTPIANELCRYNGGNGLETVKKYDRSEKYQFRSTYYGDVLYDGWNYNRGNDRHEYGDAGGTNGLGRNNYKDKRNSNPTNLLTYRSGGKSSINPKSGVIGTKIVPNEDGTYNIGGVLAQGFYRISRKGEIMPTKADDKDSFLFFFWQGVILFNKECYKFLKKVCTAYNITEGALMEDYALLVHSLSPDPFRDDQLFKDAATYTALSGDDFIVFANDQWQYFMSNKCYWFDQNGFISCDWDSDDYSKESTFDDYKRLANTIIDFSSLIDEYKIY